MWGNSITKIHVCHWHYLCQKHNISKQMKNLLHLCESESGELQLDCSLKQPENKPQMERNWQTMHTVIEAKMERILEHALVVEFGLYSRRRERRNGEKGVFSLYLAGHHQSLVWLGTPHDPPDSCQAWTPPCPGSAACHPVSPSAAQWTCTAVLDSRHAHPETAAGVAGAPLPGKFCNSATRLWKLLTIFSDQHVVMNEAERRLWIVSG